MFRIHAPINGVLETAKLGSPEAAHAPKHDFLEVNEYLMSGLVVSSIDKWFLGPVPQFPPDIIAPTHTEDLRTVIDHARAYATDNSKLTWPPVSPVVWVIYLPPLSPALITATTDYREERSITLGS